MSATQWQPLGFWTGKFPDVVVPCILFETQLLACDLLLIDTTPMSEGIK